MADRVEEVAQALAASEREEWRQIPPWDELSPFAREQYRRLARVALKAAS